MKLHRQFEVRRVNAISMVEGEVTPPLAFDLERDVRSEEWKRIGENLMNFIVPGIAPFSLYYLIQAEQQTGKDLESVKPEFIYKIKERLALLEDIALQKKTWGNFLECCVSFYLVDPEGAREYISNIVTPQHVKARLQEIRNFSTSSHPMAVEALFIWLHDPESRQLVREALSKEHLANSMVQNAHGRFIGSEFSPAAILFRVLSKSSAEFPLTVEEVQNLLRIARADLAISTSAQGLVADLQLLSADWIEFDLRGKISVHTKPKAFIPAQKLPARPLI